MMDEQLVRDSRRVLLRFAFARAPIRLRMRAVALGLCAWSTFCSARDRVAR